MSEALRWKAWVDRARQPATEGVGVRDLDEIARAARRASDAGRHLEALDLYCGLYDGCLARYEADDPRIFEAEACFAAELGLSGNPCGAAEVLEEVVDALPNRADPGAARIAEAARAWRARCDEVRAAVAGFEIRDGLRYTFDDVWMSPPPVGKVGITDVLARRIGSVQEVEWLIEATAVVEADQPVLWFRATNNAVGRDGWVRLCVPVSGLVVDCNERLGLRRGRPGDGWDTLVSSPYDDGWVLELATDKEGERAYADLLDPQSYREELAYTVASHRNRTRDNELRPAATSAAVRDSSGVRGEDGT